MVSQVIRPNSLTVAEDTHFQRMMMASGHAASHHYRVRESRAEHRLRASTVRADHEAPIPHPFVHRHQVLRPRNDRQPLLEVMRLPSTWRFLDYELRTCCTASERRSLAVIDFPLGIDVRHKALWRDETLLEHLVSMTHGQVARASFSSLRLT